MDESETDLQVQLQDLQIKKLDAERRRLDLESQEIERRLNSKWWSSTKFPQYLLAVSISASLLFAWAKGYLEPILRAEGALQELAAKRNAELNLLLSAKNERLDNDAHRLTEEKDKLQAQKLALEAKASSLTAERDKFNLEVSALRQQTSLLRESSAKLQRERDQLDAKRLQLEKEQNSLKTVIAGTRIAIERVESGKSKFFSILNEDDPITRLRRVFGWQMGSDNRLSRLGYYQVLQHSAIGSGRKVILLRESDIERLKKDGQSEWTEYLKSIAKESPLLALDYSYLALLASEGAPIGGLLYLADGRVVDFHAPMVDWAKELPQYIGWH